MPLPIVQQAIDVQPPEKNCRVFVSYSHRDMKDAEQFIKFFSLKLRGTEKLRITEEQVFFDRDRLLAGDEWDESIQRALDQARYFILLISVDSPAEQSVVASVIPSWVRAELARRSRSF